MSHSDRAKNNMTNQMRGQLEFLENNLKKKEKRLARNRKFFGRLPGFRWTIKRQLRGVLKVIKDIDTIKSQIIQMQKDDKIFVIIDV